jgi:hypothetical protein
MNTTNPSFIVVQQFVVGDFPYYHHIQSEMTVYFNAKEAVEDYELLKRCIIPVEELTSDEHEMIGRTLIGVEIHEVSDGYVIRTR